MENFARVVFTIVFITILAGVIVAFGLFAVAPAEKVVKVFKGGFTSDQTEEPTPPVIEQTPATPAEGGQPSVPGTSQDTGTPPTPPPPTPGTPENPQQSSPVTESDIPSGTVRISIGSFTFTPSRFTVRAGSVVELAIASEDRTHVFKFNDPSLANVAVGVGPLETRLITFYAPSTPGEYGFYCDVPGHRVGGETGVMVVQ